MISITNAKKRNNRFPQTDFDLLLAHAIRKPKEFLFTHPEYKLSLRERLRLAYFLWLYRRGYSVATITQHKEFYGLDFYVNKHTLIPRPETEIMVEEAIKEILNTKYQILNTLLIDIGTGTGCIPIAIMKTLKHENIKTFAVDISQRALRVARKNALTHGVQINFLHGNLMEPIVRNYELLTMNYELVVITANLPYLTPKQFTSEPSIRREPRSALVTNNGGLALYEQLLRQIKSLFDICHLTFVIFFEIDPSQTQRITSLIQHYLPQASVEIKHDLAGQDRLVKIVIHNNKLTKNLSPATVT